MKESKIFSEQNLTEKIHYVYRVTIDEKYYIGKRTGLLNDLHTGAYTTSSKLVQEKLQNGMTFSKIKILKVFSTSKDALEFENRILTRVKAKTNTKFLNQSNGGKNFCLKQHTKKAKEKISEIRKEYFNPNTEAGIKRRKNISGKAKAQFDPNTELGQQNRENMSKIIIEYFKTEQGVKNKENHSEFMTEYYKTEQGKKLRENISEIRKEYFNPNTEAGIKRRKNKSQSAKAQFDPNTERGRRNRKNHSEFMKEKAKEHLQNRKNASILGELMFNEVFIKENLLITDDKNKPRFLLSVYSKLTGYSESHIRLEKRCGKLSFLHGINSIKLSEEDELAKIKEIEAIIKSRNEKE